MTAAEVIELLGLVPLPDEGGHFRETWRTGPDGAPLGTAIVYLLTGAPGSFSAMHRLDADEIWHAYAGQRIFVQLLHPDGTSTTPVLGPDLAAGQRPQLVVPAGTWMGASLVPGEPYDTFGLVGTTMAPGFRPAGFELGDRQQLIAGWPDAAEQIVRLTRS